MEVREEARRVLSTLRVRELRRRLRDIGVDSTGCVEKGELVSLLLAHDPGAGGAEMAKPSRQTRKKQRKEARRTKARRAAAAAVNLAEDDEELAFQRALAMSMRDAPPPLPASEIDLVDLTALSDGDGDDGDGDDGDDGDDLELAMAASFGMSLTGYRQQMAQMAEFQGKQDARDAERIQALDGLTPELRSAAEAEYAVDLARQKECGGSKPSWDWAVGLARDKERVLQSARGDDDDAGARAVIGAAAEACSASSADSASASASASAYASTSAAPQTVATTTRAEPPPLRAEPPADAAGVRMLRLRLPSGRMVKRRFLATATVREIVDVARALSETGCDDDVQIATNFPRAVLSDAEKTLAELGIESRTALTVELVG